MRSFQLQENKWQETCRCNHDGASYVTELLARTGAQEDVSLHVEEATLDLEVRVAGGANKGGDGALLQHHSQLRGGVAGGAGVDLNKKCTPVTTVPMTFEGCLPCCPL